MITPLRLSALLFLGLTASAADQWTQFRGPNGSGVDSSAGYPVEFSPPKTVVWETAIPYGQSSPVLAGGRVYLTASEPDKLLTICLDAKTGKELWRRAIPRKKAQTIFRANDPASPPPAADENGVVAFFAEFGLVAYSADGKTAGTCLSVHSRTSMAWPHRRFLRAAWWCRFAINRAAPSCWRWTAPGASAGRLRVPPWTSVGPLRWCFSPNSSYSVPLASIPTISIPANPAGGCPALPEVGWGLPSRWETLCFSPL